jgi:hypothetical protein
LEGLEIADVGIFYVHLVDFTAIWYIFWLFGIFSPILVCCCKTNLATLISATQTMPAMAQWHFLLENPLSLLA